MLLKVLIELQCTHDPFFGFWELVDVHKEMPCGSAALAGGREGSST